jgi:glucose uptake protein GlcU
MNITVLFEQVFGLYLVLSGILVLIKQEHIVSVGRMFGKDYALRLSMGALITLGGLFMVLTYRDWTTTATSLVTLVGWLVLLKGVALLFMSDRQINSLMGAFFKGHVYRAWGAAALIAGLYLAALGFGIV